ncbi:hypothetical protein [Agrococcus sp. ProA11]|uniref:hypothetical protein n=1 Tax=Agrococcus chionoecetis TaxID=3153752 RepID=UPI00326124E7
MTGSFDTPLVRVRVALAPAGVRLLAVLTLIVGAATIASIAASPPQASRATMTTVLVLALSALTVLVVVLPLLDGRFRPLLVGAPALGLGLVAAASIGLGAAWPAAPLAWVVVVIGAATMIYHLLGRGLREPEA